MSKKSLYAPIRIILQRLIIAQEKELIDQQNSRFGAQQIESLRKRPYRISQPTEMPLGDDEIDFVFESKIFLFELGKEVFNFESPEVEDFAAVDLERSGA